MARDKQASLPFSIITFVDIFRLVSNRAPISLPDIIQSLDADKRPQRERSHHYINDQTLRYPNQTNNIFISYYHDTQTHIKTEIINLVIINLEMHKASFLTVNLAGN
ncbi:hypothetical protein [Photobacterium gaetbulicola]|uniref:hypothetical protein n=1 Tax=Photobacterium gaetbulicola TaxID=1295392 RepID=UPI0012E0A015|nr:hypothetical protein [Photobacterium gaetbulicola]